MHKVDVNGVDLFLAPGIEQEAWTNHLRALSARSRTSDAEHESHSSRVQRLTLAGKAYALKTFPCQSRWKDRIDRFRGSRARRSLQVGVLLQEARVGTPAPVACVERWDGHRLVENLLVTAWAENCRSFKDVLIAAYTDYADSPTIMNLLKRVAVEIRKMHDAGIAHRDLGNQNILIPNRINESPQFIDLNRARRLASLSSKERAFDLSRIHLPSNLRRILMEMYFDARAPRALIKLERRYRRRFAFHTATRRLRHPLRTLRQKPNQPQNQYPAPRDLWIWDPCSAQPIGAWKRRDRNRLIHKRDLLCMASATVMQLTPARMRARRLKTQAYQKPVHMAQRVGLAVHENSELGRMEAARLKSFPPLHLFARFYAHESPEQWMRLADRLERYKDRGHGISVGLVQDRRSVRDISRWKRLLDAVLPRIGGFAEEIQIGQAPNRVKWGIWQFEEYARMADAVASAVAAYPHLRLMGPSVIDYEPYYLCGLLASLPGSVRFNAVSHLLYVDRRGAPENEQRGPNTLSKIALLRAITERSSNTENRLVLSEVNWPLENTGIWSPICSPYLFSGQVVDGGVAEATYAHYMIRYFLIALCSGLADRVIWWRLTAHGFGLIDERHPDGPRCRPAFYAFRRFAELMDDAVFEEKLEGKELHGFRFTSPHHGRFLIAYAQQGAEALHLDVSCSRMTSLHDGSSIPFEGAIPADGVPRVLFEDSDALP